MIEFNFNAGIFNLIKTITMDIINCKYFGQANLHDKDVTMKHQSQNTIFKNLFTTIFVNLFSKGIR